jgi:hypothetical protein
MSFTDLGKRSSDCLVAPRRILACPLTDISALVAGPPTSPTGTVSGAPNARNLRRLWGPTTPRQDASHVVTGSWR